MKHAGYKTVPLIWLFFLITAAYAYLPQNFTVTNQTGMTITAVYISVNDANAWSSNILTRDKLPNNETFEFIRNVDQFTCIQDLKFVADDGKEYYMNNVNLCSTTSIALVPPDKIDHMKEKTEK